MTNHVYLVDDDEAVRNALSLLLETVGLNVCSFASPEKFLSQVADLLFRG
jgi:FixJ family two-component response regulator